MFTDVVKFLIAFVVLICKSTPKLAPDYVKPCPKLTPDCLKKTIQEALPEFVKGIPSLGINTTDPLYGGLVQLNLPGDLKIEFSDGVLLGFRKCIVDSAKYEDMVAELSVHCNTTLKGKYKASGRVLIFTIDGEGDAKIKTHDFAFNAKIRFEDRTRDGVVYREIKDSKVTYSFDNKVTFNFTNLFKGNPELTQSVLKFLNQNYKQVLEEFGKPITDMIVVKTMKILKQFFSSIPKDELISPE